MKKKIAIFCLFLFGCAASTPAQNLIISAEQVRDWMTSGKKVALIDVRSYDEYRSGHIPGAVSIPAERIAADRKRLPQDRTTNLIFYCRGVG